MWACWDLIGERVLKQSGRGEGVGVRKRVYGW